MQVGSGIFDPSLRDPEHCNATNTTCWELALAGRHYHPTATTLATHLLAGCPSQGELGLPPALKSSPDKVFQDFSPEAMTFNPSVQPPPKKAKRGKMTQISTAQFDKLGKFSPDVDYFSNLSQTV